MSSLDKLTIDTPEQTALEFPLAGVGSRFLAIAADTAIQIIVGFFLLIVLAIVIPALSVFGGLGPQWAIALLIFAGFLLNSGYYAFFEAIWNGQTPGKRLLGIRVIQWRGTAISFYQAAVRNLLRVVDSMPWLLLFGFYGLGFAVAACNRRQRRLGDFAANTLVVHVERRSRPIQSLHDAGHHCGEVKARRRIEFHQQGGKGRREVEQVRGRMTFQFCHESAAALEGFIAKPISELKQDGIWTVRAPLHAGRFWAI